jgi:ribulose-phosphate 3-epimerase
MNGTDDARVAVEDSFMRCKLAPSILAADFARLGEQVLATQQAGADRIHVDVMDGHFVPNLSMGPAIVQALRPVTTLPLEVHLMVREPLKFLEPFARAGADTLQVHVELGLDLLAAVRQIHALGKKAGVVINPPTPVNLSDEVVAAVDIVLIMTVNPGFGGQAFLPECLEKIRQVRQIVQRVKPTVEIEVDGGIDALTGAQCVQAGADVLVAGSSIFRAPEGITTAMSRLQAAG